METRFSLWNIRRDKSRPLGLELASPSGSYYFMYADRFVALQQKPDMPITVKYMDRHPEKAIGHHPGEILGLLVNREDGNSQISLYFGYASQRIEHDEAGNNLYGVHSEQHHLLPTREVDGLAIVLSCMYQRSERFQEYKLRSETRSSIN